MAVGCKGQVAEKKSSEYVRRTILREEVATVRYDRTSHRGIGRGGHGGFCDRCSNSGGRACR